jgi:hypothetical protein
MKDLWIDFDVGCLLLLSVNCHLLYVLWVSFYGSWDSLFFFFNPNVFVHNHRFLSLLIKVTTFFPYWKKKGSELMKAN